MRFSMSPDSVHISTFTLKQEIDIGSLLVEKVQQTESAKASIKQWFALRVTYQRELIASAALQKIEVENYVPSRTVKVKLPSGRTVRRRKALLHNYIFIHSDRATIDQLKAERLPYLRYVMVTVDGVRQPLVVPEVQMQSFIRITAADDEQVALLAEQSVDLHCGMRVRVTGGPFIGVEGVLVKIKGESRRRVVVRIEGVAMVSTPTIDSRLIEPIEA